MIETERAMKNVVRRLRKRAEDSGPMTARAYLDAANEIEKELRRLDPVAADAAGSGKETTPVSAFSERDVLIQALREIEREAGADMHKDVRLLRIYSTACAALNYAEVTE